jgi:hypothetical protein
MSIDNTKQMVNDWSTLLGLMMNTNCFHHKIQWSKTSYYYSVALDPIASFVEIINPSMRQARKDTIKRLHNIDEGLI